MGKFNEPVCFAAHRGQHDDDLIAIALCFLNTISYPLDTFDCANRGAAVFLYDQCHDGQLLEKNLFTNFVASRAGISAAWASTSVKRRPADPAPFLLPSPNA